MMSYKRSTAAILPLLAMVGVVSFPIESASAQHALGGGGALDANLGVGTRRVNMPSPVEDFRARNLIVTGNVAGGRGFRGTVGYPAEADFRGATGVDDLFRFRADSAFSAPALAASPGWQRLRFGRDIGELSLRRGDSGMTAGMHGTTPYRRDAMLAPHGHDFRVRFDEALAMPGARFDAEPPRTIGTMRDQDGTMLMIGASPLRGLTAMTADERAAQLGLSPYDLARLRMEDASQRRPRVDELRGFEREGFVSLADPTRVEVGTHDARVRLEGEQMTAILERIAHRYADRPDVVVHFDPRLLTQLDEEYADLRDRLQQMSAAERWRIEAQRATERVPPEEEALAPPDRRVITDTPDRTVRPDDDEDRPRFAPPVEVIPPGQMERLFDALRHGERVDQLAEDGNTRFDELMSRGERSLRAGEYFDAEQQFLRALRIMPGHPFAMVGAAHAQLGAGLQLPASLSIRRVLTAHPELIDARYGPDLLPSRARLMQVADAIDARIAIGAQEHADYGLVIAYIGRHLDDEDMMQRGFEMVEEAAPDDALLEVLRRVWRFQEK